MTDEPWTAEEVAVAHVLCDADLTIPDPAHAAAIKPWQGFLPYARRVMAAGVTVRGDAADENAIAAQEWMRCAWYELNAIRARSGAPEGVAQEWWDQLTNALDEMLGDGAMPWPSKAAELLVAPFKARAEFAERTASDNAAEVVRLRELLTPFAAAADKADAKIAESRELRMGELGGEASAGLGILFKHLWAARAALAAQQKEST